MGQRTANWRRPRPPASRRASRLGLPNPRHRDQAVHRYGGTVVTSPRRCDALIGGLLYGNRASNATYRGPISGYAGRTRPRAGHRDARDPRPSTAGCRGPCPSVGPRSAAEPVEGGCGVGVRRPVYPGQLLEGRDWQELRSPSRYSSFTKSARLPLWSSIRTSPRDTRPRAPVDDRDPGLELDIDVTPVSTTGAPDRPPIGRSAEQRDNGTNTQPDSGATNPRGRSPVSSGPCRGRCRTGPLPSRPEPVWIEELEQAGAAAVVFHDERDRMSPRRGRGSSRPPARGRGHATASSSVPRAPRSGARSAGSSRISWASFRAPRPTARAYRADGGTSGRSSPPGPRTDAGRLLEVRSAVVTSSG